MCEQQIQVELRSYYQWISSNIERPTQAHIKATVLNFKRWLNQLTFTVQSRVHNAVYWMMPQKWNGVYPPGPRPAMTKRIKNYTGCRCFPPPEPWFILPVEALGMAGLGHCEPEPMKLSHQDSAERDGITIIPWTTATILTSLDCKSCSSSFFSNNSFAQRKFPVLFCTMLL